MPIRAFADYDFNQPHLIQQALRDNFGDRMPETVRLSGHSVGALDVFGTAPAPAAPGEVRLDVAVVTRNRTDRDAHIEQLRGLYEKGVARLFRQVTDDDDLQWCEAVVTDVQVSESEDRHTDLIQPVTLLWFVSHPFWLGAASEVDVWQPFAVDVWDTDAADTWVTGQSASISGALSVVTVDNPGNVPVAPRLTLTATDSVVNPVVTRVVKGVAVDRVAYTGTLAPGDVWVVDAHAESPTVTVNDSSAYSAITVERARWLHLEPGSNTLHLTADNSTAAATLTWTFNARYI